MQTIFDQINQWIKDFLIGSWQTDYIDNSNSHLMKGGWHFSRVLGNAADIIKAWQKQGAKIIYCISRRKKQAHDMANLLKNHGFRGTYLVAREPRESYADLVEILKTDILIEDDCKSIGGAWQMCFTKVKPKVKEKIKHIAVPEFKGIDHLSVSIKQL